AEASPERDRCNGGGDVMIVLSSVLTAVDGLSFVEVRSALRADFLNWDEEITLLRSVCFLFFFQAEDGIRDRNVTGVQTCALPISIRASDEGRWTIRCVGSHAGMPDHRSLLSFCARTSIPSRSSRIRSWMLQTTVV